MEKTWKSHGINERKGLFPGLGKSFKKIIAQNCYIQMFIYTD